MAVVRRASWAHATHVRCAQNPARGRAVAGSAARLAWQAACRTPRSARDCWLAAGAAQPRHGARRARRADWQASVGLHRAVSHQPLAGACTCIALPDGLRVSTACRTRRGAWRRAGPPRLWSVHESGAVGPAPRSGASRRSGTVPGAARRVRERFTCRSICVRRASSGFGRLGTHIRHSECQFAGSIQGAHWCTTH